jgi:hypothetical protein
MPTVAAEIMFVAILMREASPTRPQMEDGFGAGLEDGADPFEELDIAPYVIDERTGFGREAAAGEGRIQERGAGIADLLINGGDRFRIKGAVGDDDMTGFEPALHRGDHFTAAPRCRRRRSG